MSIKEPTIKVLTANAPLAVKETKQIKIEKDLTDTVTKDVYLAEAWLSVPSLIVSHLLLLKNCGKSTLYQLIEEKQKYIGFYYNNDQITIELCAIMYMTLEDYIYSYKKREDHSRTLAEIFYGTFKCRYAMQDKKLPNQCNITALTDLFFTYCSCLDELWHAIKTGKDHTLIYTNLVNVVCTIYKTLQLFYYCLY